MTTPGSGYWRRSDGQFVAQVTVRTPSGKRQRKSLYGRTADEVIAKKQAVLAEQAAGHATSTRRSPTVSEYGIAWLTGKKQADVNDGYFSVTTLQQYTDTWRRHIDPDLGHLRLDELNPPLLRQWLERKGTMVSAATGKPLAPRSRRQIQAVLRTALNDAVMDELLRENPLLRVRGPRVPRSETKYLNCDEVTRFLTAARATRLYALWLTLIMLGLRVNEALALRWQDVNLEDGTVEVRRSLARVRGPLDATTGRSKELLLVKSTKVQETEGVLVLPPMLIEALQQHRVGQNRERLACRAWHDTGLLFTTSVGTALDNRNLLDVGKRLARSVGIDSFTVHGLRHTAASALLAEGVPIEAIQKLLRHTRIQTTSDLYAHMDLEALRNAASVMDTRLRRLTT